MASGTIQKTAHMETITAQVTVSSAGAINLSSVVGNKIPLFAYGTSGKIVNGTNANTYLPFIIEDGNPGTTKTITLICLS